MGLTTTAKWTFLATGGYALLCAPAVLLAERFGWPQAPLHATQFVATLLCLPAAAVFIWRTRGAAASWQRSCATVACTLSGLYLAFVAFVLLTIDFSVMD